LTLALKEQFGEKNGMFACCVLRNGNPQYDSKFWAVR